MLTATYTLVALSVEQASVRVGLLALRHYARSTLVRQNRISLRQLEYACATLDQLYQACHWRKIEIYLIPAIRGGSERADQLLDELSRLNQAALDAVRTLQERIMAMDGGVETQVAQVCDGIETFCAALLQRLEKEEQELFALARRVICGEAWFAIANQFMLHDARADEARRTRQVLPSSVTAPPAAPQLALSVWPDGADDRPYMVPQLAALPLPNGGAAPSACQRASDASDHAWSPSSAHSLAHTSAHTSAHPACHASPLHLPRQPGANRRATAE